MNTNTTKDVETRFNICIYVMKDILVKMFVVSLWLSLIWYIVWLYMQWVTIVADEQYNLVSMIVIVLLWLYMVSLALVWSFVPTNRYTLALIWFVVMYVSHIYLIDQPDLYVYSGDILKLISVFLIVAWVSKLLVTKAIQKAKEEQEIEVIEV